MPDEPVEIYDWPGIQGRGEFVRLALEEAGVPYLDVARLPRSEGGGVAAVLRALRGELGGRLPFAPPVLRMGDIVVAQTAAILHFLAPRLGLVPGDEATRLWAHQLQLTVADLVAEVHDTHHPVAGSLTYEEQRREARRRAGHFIRERMPKFLGYFERLLEAGDGQHLVQGAFSYVDLSMFQVLEGLGYAFPRTLEALTPKLPLLTELREAVRARPRIAAYLATPRRLPFSTQGIFRHYPELEKPPRRLSPSPRPR